MVLVSPKGMAGIMIAESGSTPKSNAIGVEEIDSCDIDHLMMCSMPNKTPRI